MAIKFDVEELIGKLDIIQKTQIPFAAKQALKQYGFLLTKTLLPAEMNKTLTAPSGAGKPVPPSLSAFRYDVDGMTLKITVRDNQKQNEYLYSAFYGGKPKRTALATSIFKASGMYGVPAYGNLSALGALDQYADIKRSYASKISGALQGRSFEGGRLVVVSDLSKKKKRGGLAEKGNGIYRVKGSSIIRLFTLLKEEPTLGVAMPYEKFVTETSEKRLPGLLSLQLQRAMASR
jgi:hypothetical protein